ncbi:hypothetical protein GCM10010123_31970 [Pilimelia anulata]|uniref:Uncharacterized protein n=1 Tax=Pilimelia anulata TaxID=53371 RepID=A0A8J3B7D9_9ACTN|nr:SDR family NAD(P)-dependent oxidoreductase [Pilimelia anulata]GGJ99617.1 hypothetical protein GCM10010123_31970 [Pilimelia anulata]
MADDAQQAPPPQEQPYPGRSGDPDPAPRDTMADHPGRDLLRDRVALITGGDSGIGRAVAVAFAKEGADVALAYLNEHDDAEYTAELVRAAGRRCVCCPATRPRSTTAPRSSSGPWSSWAAGTCW